MTGTLVKLAFAGIRARLLASALTILLSGTAAATIVLRLEVGATVRDPWRRTFDAAHGAHVLANVQSEADARTIRALPGIADHGPAVPSANVSVTTQAGDTDRLQLAGLPARPQVNRPVRTEGSELRHDAIVLERSFAEALGLGVGASVRLADSGGGSVELPIVGTAISPSQPRYPRRNPGIAWVTPATLDRIAPESWRSSWVLAPPGSTARSGF
jgi:putative ABC transport system permease protein